MTKEQLENPVLRPDGIRRLLDGGGDDLTDDERALLLALIGVEAEAGRSFSEEERAAIDKLESQVEGYDADDLAQAVKHLVTAESRKERELEWPELKQKLREIHSSEE